LDKIIVVIVVLVGVNGHHRASDRKGRQKDSLSPLRDNAITADPARKRQL
jgi:hypothetical protein